MAQIIISEQQDIQLRHVYAAGLLPICKSTGRICLQQRGKDITQPNKWCNFGGGKNVGETPKSTAIREFWEESGVIVPLTVIPSYTSKKGDYFTYYNYLGLCDDEFEIICNKITIDGDIEVQDYKWLNLEDFEKLVHSDDAHWGLKQLWNNDSENIKKHAK